MPGKGFQWGADELRRRALIRMWSRVDKSAGPDRCWLWGGPVIPSGYGYIGLNYRHVYVHRLVYEEAHGPIPDGMQIDHVKEWGCEHRNCVNPAHLQPVTIQENQLRSDSFSGINGRKTHCIRDHEFTPENTITTPARPNRRNCRTCRNDRRRAADSMSRAA